MSFTPNHTPFELDPARLSELALDFASNPIYLDNEEWQNTDNPYRRQLRPQIIKYLNFSTPLPKEDLLDYSALAANRLLATVYETDMMFLPKGPMTAEHWADFKSFYSSTNRARGEMIRPYLERHVFGFLDDIEVSGEWTKESLVAYLGRLRDQPSVPMASEKAIRESSDPKRAARNWLIQFAPDFLSEASPMIRNAMGYYGPVQSEWFKIIIDEYGYGVHESKHSTLFERTMTSAGLSPDLHRYWQYYLTSSLMMSNYFHYLGRNHEHFFRYLGALYYTETTLVDFCERGADLLTEVFGGEVDVEYFTEHVHIDTHHGRMALEKLILPIVEQCGEAVIPEIVRGFEEYRAIAQLADDDFATQVAWMDAGPQNKKLHDPVWKKVESGEVTAPVAYIVEPRGELSNTHQHDGDELCHIASGTMKFVSGYDSHQILEAGEGTVIWRNRLHGAIIESEECVYEIHSVGDYRACLS
ncbi:iron-containing redox enzyme family protein [Sphaerisporangium corydalis]|uniref:Iron-containing redox enzyme family protein n=1 Tax=Sphaerisporangium corydalis TaxID=1441875 RepID=A0ABV9E7F2_9ACTN|nr:iron-containing redox enzyme family protein [Sphaerisporangium corydalis]